MGINGELNEIAKEIYEQKKKKDVNIKLRGKEKELNNYEDLFDDLKLEDVDEYIGEEKQVEYEDELENENNIDEESTNEPVPSIELSAEESEALLKDIRENGLGTPMVYDAKEGKLVEEQKKKTKIKIEDLTPEQLAKLKEKKRKKVQEEKEKEKAVKSQGVKAKAEKTKKKLKTKAEAEAELLEEKKQKSTYGGNSVEVGKEPEPEKAPITAFLDVRNDYNTDEIRSKIDAVIKEDLPKIKGADRKVIQREEINKVYINEWLTEGDEVLNRLAELEDNSIDFIFFDPFNRWDNGEELKFSSPKDRDAYIKKVQKWLLLGYQKLKHQGGGLIVGCTQFTITSFGDALFDPEMVKRLLTWYQPEKRHDNLSVERGYIPAVKSYLWAVKSKPWTFQLLEGDTMFDGEFKASNGTGETPLKMAEQVIKRFTTEGQKVLEIYGTNTPIKEAVEKNNRIYVEGVVK